MYSIEQVQCLVGQFLDVLAFNSAFAIEQKRAGQFDDFTLGEKLQREYFAHEVIQKSNITDLDSLLAAISPIVREVKSACASRKLPKDDKAWIALAELTAIYESRGFKVGAVDLWVLPALKRNELPPLYDHETQALDELKALCKFPLYSILTVFTSGVMLTYPDLRSVNLERKDPVFNGSGLAFKPVDLSIAVLQLGIEHGCIIPLAPSKTQSNELQMYSAYQIVFYP